MSPNPKHAVPVMTVAQLFNQLDALMKSGYGDLPVVSTFDRYAVYPTSVMTTYNTTGYKDSVLISVEKHLKFEEVDTPHTGQQYCGATASKLAWWNAEAVRVEDSTAQRLKNVNVTTS